MAESIVVEPSGRILAQRVRWARSMRERSRGLIGAPQLERGEALVIVPAKQVHTFRMTYAIDVVFCDKYWVVRHVVREMAPRRMSKLVLRAYYVVELNAGGAGPEVVRGTQLRAPI